MHSNVGGSCPKVVRACLCFSCFCFMFLVCGVCDHCLRSPVGLMAWSSQNVANTGEFMATESSARVPQHFSQESRGEQGTARCMGYNCPIWNVLDNFRPIIRNGASYIKYHRKYHHHCSIRRSFVATRRRFILWTRFLRRKNAGLLTQHSSETVHHGAKKTKHSNRVYRTRFGRNR